jgi:hypothetical protein
MTKKIVGVKIPDSKMAREVTQLIRNAEGDLLFYHSTRVYFWGSLIGRRKRLTLIRSFSTQQLCSTTSALPRVIGRVSFPLKWTARRPRANFFRTIVSPRDILKVWTAVALHTTPDIPEYMHPEIALLQQGDEMDVVGQGSDHFPSEQREAVTAAYPRSKDFKREIIEAFDQGVKHGPDSTFGTFNDDIVALNEPNFRRASLCRSFLGSHWKH